MNVDELLDRAEPHPSGLGGKQVRIQYGNYVVSIVGGRTGLYGDFVDTFEVAVMSKDGFGDFKTKHFFPDATDDVLGWISKMDLIEVLKIVEEGSRT